LVDEGGDVQSQKRRSARCDRFAAAAFLLAVITSAALSFSWLDHGDPGFLDRCIDAHHPLHTLAAADRAHDHFADKGLTYPPLVLRTIGAAQRAWLSLQDVDAERLIDDMNERRTAIAAQRVDPVLRDELALQVRALIVIGRAVSAAFAVLCVVFVFALASLLLDRTAGAIAAWLATLDVNLFVYAHTGNVDVPYVALALAALALAAFAVRTRRRWPIPVAGVAAGFALAAKDQAYGLFALSFPTYLVAHGRASGRAAPWGAGLLAVLLAVATYVLVPGFPPRLDWVADHFAYVMGPGSEPFRMANRDLAGLLAISLLTLQLLLLGAGVPFVAAAALGAAWCAWRRRLAAVLLAAPVVSYWLTFLFVAGYVYPRFTLPLGLVLGIFAAAPLAMLLQHRGAPRAVAALALGLLLATGAGRITAAARRLAETDSRTAAEHHLREHHAGAETIDVLLTGTASDFRIPPWRSIRPMLEGAEPPGRAPAEVLVVCRRSIDPVDDRFEAAVVELGGARYARGVRFEPEAPHLLLDRVFWPPRVTFYARIDPAPAPEPPR
jgi:hypothetical protein